MDWISLGLSRDPFERCPELDDACLPNKISALLAELQSCLRAPQGVSVMIAEAAGGKSIAAASFVRRIAGAAQVALVTHPASSVSSIARDALAGLDPAASDFTLDDDWGVTLRSSVARRTSAGRATAIVIDDADRLSPQVLEDLAGLFADDPALRLHMFLFGRPLLLGRMQAGAAGALNAGLLHVARLAPLGVRESVRYLERRLAMCGGALCALYTDDAIDEIVQKASGRLLSLEEVAAEAMRRATRRGATRASGEDVTAIAVLAVAEEEVMAGHQQPLKFSLADDTEPGAVEWGDETGAGADVEWGDEADESEEWTAEDEPELEWETSPHHFSDEADDEDEEVLSASRVPTAAADSAPSPRRRMVGPAVLTVGACLGLVWAANHVPGPATDSHHGRDAMLFARPVATAPKEIMRLARTVEAADADAQVDAWRAQPPRRSLAAVERPPAAPTIADARTPDGREGGSTEARVAENADSKHVGPLAVVADLRGVREAPKASRAVEMTSPRRLAVPEAKGQALRGSGTSIEVSKSTPAPHRVATPDPVYTVQLGAFKTRRNAEDLASRLGGKPTRILREGGFYRVMSGSFDSKRDATVHEASLRRAGYTTFVRTAVF